jgi:hypothetical protein
MVSGASFPRVDFFRLGQELLDQFGVEPMAASVSAEAAHELAAGQGEIAHQVEKLVADALVGETELIFDRAVFAEDQQVAAACPQPEPLR